MCILFLVFLFYHAYWSGNGTQTTVLHTYFLAESVPSIKSLGESWAFKGNFEKLESLRTKCADKLFVVLTHFLSADSSYGLPYAKFQFLLCQEKGMIALVLHGHTEYFPVFIDLSAHQGTLKYTSFLTCRLCGSLLKS